MTRICSSKAAIARPAFDEGIAHIERAIALIAPQLKAGQRPVLEHALNLQVQLGVISLVRKGYSADATLAAFEHALVLADRVGDTPMRYPALYGHWVGVYVKGHHAQALSRAEALVRVAEKSTQTAPLVVAHRVVGTSYCFQGRFANAQTHLDHALALYDPSEHKGLEDRFGQDVGAGVHCYLMINLMLLGNSQRAEQHVLEVERSASATDHANTICYARTHLGIFSLLVNDDAKVERQLATVWAIAKEHNLLLWLAFMPMLQDLLAAGRGEKASIARYMKADAELVASNARLFVPQLRIEMGWRALAMGLRTQANDLATMAKDMIAETGETVMLADLHRLEGALALDAGDPHGAEECLTAAIEVAREQGSKLWELRASIDLARLWASTGRAAAARDLLKPVRDSIAKGDCIPERAVAQEMLTALAG